MTELGNRLKEAREAKGLSLDDLQEVTKIQKRYLVGIEEGNYEMMPGKFYVRAFIKQYCEAVGLDSEEIFEQYKSNVPVTHQEELPELSRVQTRKTVSASQSKIIDMIPKILVGVVVIGVAVLIYVWMSNAMGDSKNEQAEDTKQSENVGFNESEEFSKEKEPKETDTNKEAAKPNEEEKDEPIAEEVEQELNVINSSGKNSTYELKNTEAFTVKLVSSGEPWVGITNGNGGYLYQGTLKVDEEKELDVKDESVVILNLGRAQDVEIYVNNEKLEYAISPTEVLSQKITIQFTKADSSSTQ
ncbi:helix-turn-helix domain-containing protein [Peribacillus asahii]|uniref:Uncharacterized protein n=1 Tax=Peribacillus asahii TaxID=228899 RepID=A0A3Q9RM11_9BACI|nr:helix-turn-helix domain-containing protein [Peribacillus asahii]AZV42345.1 hypothetical protein BAOM_1735 [Peribacillus asahii]USK86649.1 DUF4115 domain-containing protein [Peribacillus asahii]